MAFEFARGATIGLQKKQPVAWRPSLLTLLSHPDLWRYLRPAAEGVAGLVIAASLPSLHPHPLAGPIASLLVVVLMAARYGFGAGVATGGLAAATFLGQQGVPASAVLGLFGHRGAIAAAGLLPLSGALVGLIGDAHRRTALGLIAQLEVQRTRLAALAERHSVLVLAKEQQDQRIVGQVDTLQGLYEASCALDVLEPERIPPAALALVGRLLQAPAVAWYRREGERFELVAAQGEHPGRREALALEGPLLDWVQRGQGVWRHQGEGRLAGAVRGPDGQASELLVVERLPFMMLHAESERSLELVAHWAGHALANARAHVAALRHADGAPTRRPSHDAP